MAQTIDPRELEQFPERFAYDAESGQYIRKHTPEWSAWFARKRAEAAEQQAEGARFIKELDKLRWQASREGVDVDNPERFHQWLHQPVGVEDTGEYAPFDPDVPRSLMPVLRYVTRFEQAHRAAKRIDPMDGVQFKSAIEVKAAPSGTLSGYLAVFGNADAQDDIIERGAFENTLKSARLTGRPYLVPMLLQHDPAKPIGGFTSLHEDTHGLKFQAKIDLNTQNGREAYSGIKEGYLSGMSIGYKTVREGWDSGKRLLKEIALVEGSVVTFPANDLARIAMAE